MNKQKNRDDKYNRELIDSYKHNLALLLDALKDELQDVNKDKSLQFNNFKTILWIGIVFIGIAIKTIEYSPALWVFIVFTILASLGVLFSLLGMLEGRYSVYTSVGRPQRIASIPNNEWSKTQGYLTVIYSYRRAIKYNGISLIRRARWIRKAKYFTIASFVSLIVLSLSTFHCKGVEMPKKKPPVQPIVRPVETGKRSNESSNIKRAVATKDSKKPNR